jgi:hypothetical protein
LEVIENLAKPPNWPTMIQEGRNRESRKPEMNKERMRKEMAALSPTEKIKILERLRDRSLSLARAGLRKDSNSGLPDAPPKEKTKP